MPLESYEASAAAIDFETEAHVRFGMRDDGLLVPCRVSFDALRGLFAIEGMPFDPLDLFLGSRSAIEEAASDKYEREGALDGMLDLEEVDFV